MANDFSSVISLQIKGLDKIDTLEQRLSKIQNYKIKIDLDTSSTKALSQLKTQLESIQKTAKKIFSYTGGSSKNLTGNSNTSYSSSAMSSAEKEALNAKKAWQNGLKNLAKMDKTDGGYQSQSNYVKQLKDNYLQLNSALGKTSQAYKTKNAEITSSLKLQLQEINQAKTVKALNTAQTTLSSKEKEAITAYKHYANEKAKLAKMDTSDGGYQTQANYVNNLESHYNKLDSSLNKTSQAYKNQTTAIKENLNVKLKDIETANKVTQANYSKTNANNSWHTMANFAAVNTKAYNQYASQFQSIASLYGKSEKGDKEANAQWSGLLSQMQADGIVQPSFLSQVANGFTNIGKSLLSMVNPTTLLMKYFPQMITTVRGIDSAMTELYKVTDNSKQQYNEFSQEVKSISQEIGTTQTEMINSTADFARLGYSLTESTSLAKQANLYKNVGDMDISHATEYMISTLKAYNMQSSEASHIVDAYNEVGNNYAISSEDLGEAIERAGAALSAANNSFEESIGLVTAANEALQNPESTGTMLKTIAMRIRGASTELEDAGLSTDGMATSTSKLRDELLSLSGVDILETGGTAFKSTYDIMKELSEVWDDLSDLTQANITELIAGKRGGTIMASLMSNFDDAEAAAQSAINSTGSAIRENESVLDSIDGRITKVKSTFESLSSDIVSSNLIKYIVSGADTVLSVIEKIFSTLGTGVSSAGIAAIVATLVKISKLSIKAKSNNLFQLFSTGQKGTDTGISLFLKSLSSVKDKWSAVTSAFKTDGINAALNALVSKTNQTGDAFLTAGEKIGKFGIIAAAAIATAVAAYAIYDANTVQLGELQQSLTENLNEYTDAQNEIESLTEKIKSNNEEIAELEASSSLSNAAQVASLKQSNAELQQQIAYQERLSEIAKGNASVDANSAVNYGDGAYWISPFTGTAYSTSDSFWGKFFAFFDTDVTTGKVYDSTQGVPTLQGESEDKGSYLSESETLDYAIEKYNEAKEKYNQAMSDGDKSAVESASTEMSKWSDVYTEIIDNYYNYLDAFSDDSGKALAGFEEQYESVRATITKFSRDTGATDQETLQTILDYYENDGVEEKLAKLQKQGRLTTDYLSENFSGLVKDLEDVGMTAQDVVDIFDDMYNAGGFASVLITNRLSEIQSAVSSLVSLRSTLTSAMAMSGSAGGLDFENYYNLISNGFGSAIQFTKNGIKTKYSSYQTTLAQTYNKKISENVSDIKEQYELYDDVLEAIQKSKRELAQAQIANDTDAMDTARDNISAQQSYINTIKSNIKYLEAERSVYDGLNSAVTKYIDSTTSGMEASAVTDTMSDTFYDLNKNFEKGEVSTPQAREFANLFSFSDLSGIKNSEVSDKYKEAYTKMQKFFNSDTDSEGDNTWTYSRDKVIAQLKAFENVGNIKFIDDKDVNMTTSDIMNLAKWLDISDSEATELVYALNDFGYNVNIENTTKQVDELTSSIKRYNESTSEWNRVGDYITAAQNAKNNGVTTSDELTVALNNLGGQSDSFLDERLGSLDSRKQGLSDYITQIQEARNLAKDIGDSDANDKLNAIIAQAYQAEEILNRTQQTIALMNIDTDEIIDGDGTGIEKLQDLQEAIENFNISKKLKYDAGIDIDLDAAEGDVEKAYDDLAQYVQNNFESLDISQLGLDIDEYSTVEEIETAIRTAVENGTIDLGTLAAAFNIKLNESDTANAGAKLYEQIRQAYIDAKQYADEQFGEGNYTLQFDAQGNITSVTIAPDAEIPDIDVNVNSGPVTDAYKVFNELEKKSRDGINFTLGVNGLGTLAQTQSYVNSISGIHTSTVVVNKTENTYKNNYITNSYTEFKKYMSSQQGVYVANGTAHASGDWGTKKSETALVGELGEELVVYGDKWYTVGSRGAEFKNIPAGAIVFNHKQTEELFKNGYVTSNGGRGRAHVNGTAYSSGSSSTDNKVDFASMKINKLKYDIDLADARMPLYDLDDQLNWILKNKEKAYSNLAETNRQAYMKYMQVARSSVSSEYFQKVLDGSIDVSTITDENLRQQIEACQTYVEKARDAYTDYANYLAKAADITSEKIDAISDVYDEKIDTIESEIDRYEAMAKVYKDYYGDSGIDGNRINDLDSSYWLQGAYLKKKYESLQEERDTLYRTIGEADTDLNPAATEEYIQKLNEIETEMYDVEMEIREINDSIKEMNWANFERVKDNLESTQNQLDSIVDLVGDFDSFGDDGTITQYGITQLGLLSSSLSSARQEVANYNETFAALKSEYEQGIINIDEYNDSVNENREAQLDAVSAVQKYKNSIVSLIKEGINAETSAYKELIDARKDDLSKQKEANEYAQSISEKTKSINKIQAQIAALSGDDSQASKAKLRSLQASLQEAQDELEETRQDHYYDELSDAYDDEYDRFEEAQQNRIDALTESLDKQNEAIDNALAKTSVSYETVYSTLADFANEYGVSFTSSVVDPWKNATNAANEYFNAINKHSSNVTISTEGYVEDELGGTRQGNYYDKLSDTYDDEIGDLIESLNKQNEAIDNALSETSESFETVCSTLVDNATNAANEYKINVREAAANGTYSAKGGLTLTDEMGFGSELILTKSGVIRQLNAGDTVFNAAQRSMLWQISQMPLPTILDDMQTSINSASLAGNGASANVNVNYDSLITVNGNVDESVLPNLEEICKQASEYTKRDMLTTFKKLGVG